MKTIIDFLSLIVFFALYKLYNIEIATIGLIIASIIQISLLKLIYKKVSKQELITVAIILIFGTVTLLLHNPLYLQWKVTVIQFIFAAALIISDLMGKNLVKKLMDQQIQVADNIWKKVNYAWAAFFVLVGLINIYIVYNMSMDFWVNFKVFGILGLTITALTASMFYLFAHAKK